MHRTSTFPALAPSVSLWGTVKSSGLVHVPSEEKIKPCPLPQAIIRVTSFYGRILKGTAQLICSGAGVGDTGSPGLGQEEGAKGLWLLGKAGLGAYYQTLHVGLDWTGCPSETEMMGVEQGLREGEDTCHLLLSETR